jgi:hypothetical protein
MDSVLRRRSGSDESSQDQPQASLQGELQDENKKGTEQRFHDDSWNIRMPCLP